jgi:seryl-tRNA synthetase
MGKAYRPSMRVVPVARDLACIVTREEAELAKREVFELEAKRAELRKRIDQLQKEQAGLQSAIAAKVRAATELFEERPVLCEERHVLEQGTVFLVRLDTEELVSQRAMTPEEHRTFEEERE